MSVICVIIHLVIMSDKLFTGCSCYALCECFRFLPDLKPAHRTFRREQSKAGRECGSILSDSFRDTNCS
jgi:hypothetical protein